MVRLFALKGTRLNCVDPTLGLVMGALISETPERLKDHPFLVKDGPSEAA